MATIDSGTETLFSDDSPCDLGSPLLVCCGEENDVSCLSDQQHRHLYSHRNVVTSDVQNGRLAPPNIQPYSGVLERGKVVIRPIAFKASPLTASPRFGVSGERYGSTPILTRPGSRLTLYGSSNDLRQTTTNNGAITNSNYSLDRKLRSSVSGGVGGVGGGGGGNGGSSIMSSPPLQMSSLTSLPQKLANYDSLESVRRRSPLSHITNNHNMTPTPTSNYTKHHHRPTSQHYLSLNTPLNATSSASSSITCLASITSTSTTTTTTSQHCDNYTPIINDGHYHVSNNGRHHYVNNTNTNNDNNNNNSQLSAALRDRDVALAHLRATMEHNERAIFRVHAEKERGWEREVRRLRNAVKSNNNNNSSANSVTSVNSVSGKVSLTSNNSFSGNTSGGFSNLEFNQSSSADLSGKGDKRQVLVLQQRIGQLERVLGGARSELGAVKGRLEEADWRLCRRAGEMALVKTQLRDLQNDQKNKFHELIQLRNDYKSAVSTLSLRDNELLQLQHTNQSHLQEIASLNQIIADLKLEKLTLESQSVNSLKTNQQLNREIHDLREELSEVSMSEYEGLEAGRIQRNVNKGVRKSCDDDKLNCQQNNQQICQSNLQRSCQSNNQQSYQSNLQLSCQTNNQQSCQSNLQLNCQLNSQQSCLLFNNNKENSENANEREELEVLKCELEDRKREFERERIVWIEEKEKVLRYQRQLQMNYIQMYRRTRSLESEVESLSVELELDKTGMKKKISNNSTTTYLPIEL